MRSVDRTVSFRRTLHTPAPGRQQSHSYPHHHHYCHTGRLGRPHGVAQLLSNFLLFLVICDSQTVVSRAAFRTSAATIGHHPASGADVYTDSIIISSGSEEEAEVGVGDGVGAGAGGGEGGAEVQPTSGAAINHTKLQEIVLEGLGLSELPDVRMVSVVCCRVA
uniref:Uncharacterized protein n=1 Tax=Anopheles epiroticus TaxID=199890 RepID=A0A182P1D3_9DIPT